MGESEGERLNLGGAGSINFRSLKISDNFNNLIRDSDMNERAILRFSNVCPYIGKFINL